MLTTADHMCFYQQNLKWQRLISTHKENPQGFRLRAKTKKKKRRFCWCFAGMKLALCGCQFGELAGKFSFSFVQKEGSRGGGAAAVAAAVEMEGGGGCFMHNGLSQGGLELCP